MPPDEPRTTIAGAFHVHTNRSDGSGSPEDVAAAAAQAGLDFVVFTDHGDATSQPDAPQYRSGVLCLDGVEISTSAGHYIAVGMPQAPYPLGGEPRGVVEDVARLGGLGIVAHPDSNKPGLQWQDWGAPFDGLEWLNADTEWRDESRGRLARALVEYPLRPAETLGALLDRPDGTLLRWDALTQRRRVLGLAGADAHARVGWRDDEVSGYRHGWFVRAPSYAASFRAFAVRVALDNALTRNAVADAARLMAALRAGRAYAGIDALASPPEFEFTATSGARTAREGDVLRAGEPVTFVARVNAQSEGVIVLRKDGTILVQRQVPELRVDAPAGSGVYRVEVYLSTARGEPPVPWIVSNPIYVQPEGWGASTPASMSPEIDRWSIQGGPWHVEKDAASTAQLISHDPPKMGPVEFTFGLGGGERASQYAALAVSIGNAARGHNRLAFRAQASRPMRISVQARRPEPAERWQRSIYLDEQARDIVLPFSDMTAVGTTSAPSFEPDRIDTFLFVVDTTNTRTGTSGSFTLSDLQVEH